MTASINNKIFLRGPKVEIELLADVTGIKPGMLLEATATGCKPQATSVSFAEILVAQEDALQGRTIADAYLDAAEVQAATGDSSAKADPVSIVIPGRGALVRLFLKAGTNYAKAVKLFPYGDGTLRATTGSPVLMIGTLVDALDLSASGAVDTLATVRIA